jgi:beta-fructofuranosidase
MLASRRTFLGALAASTAMAGVPKRFLGYPSADELQKKLVGDPLRPQFHLLPAKNWMNDPNGPIFWNGHYHMFYQYNPNAAVWGDMHWAHAVSDDMVRWRHLPIALAPTPNWNDSAGCFTGSAVDYNGVVTVLYTGVETVAPERATLRDGHNNFRETQCLATSVDPDLLAWKKHPKPVIEPPRDSSLTGFRDPFLFRHRDQWLVGVASGHKKKGGCIRLYRSKDLRSWQYLHDLASGRWTGKENANPVDSGEMWECPDFFAFGKKYVLLYSTAGNVVWETGSFDEKSLKFHSERRGLLDHGAYYAQKTQLDSKGARILWGWIPERRPDSELIAAGWAGCMALPRVLSLTADGDLQMTFAPDLQSLRVKSFPIPQYDFPPRDVRASSVELPGITLENICAELVWKFSLSFSTLNLSDRHGVWWSISYTQENSKSTMNVNHVPVEIPVSPDNQPSFHLFIDGSVAELIIDQRHAITSRFYRRPEGPLHIELGAMAAAGKLPYFEAWQLRPISSDRLTT